MLQMTWPWHRMCHLCQEISSVQEAGGDDGTALGTADAALDLCALAPALLQPGTKPTCNMSADTCNT